MVAKRIVLVFAVAAAISVDSDDFDTGDPREVMVAQESRNYHTFVAPPVRIIKPNGVTNSHRPQYDLDSLEEDLASLDVRNFFEASTRKSLYKTYNPYNSMNKELMIRDAVLRALERKDHVGKFAQVLPIIRAMSGSQRVALASLVASQVSTPPGKKPLNLSQVRSMFRNENNSTTELMLPILLDMANLFRRALRSGKDHREVKIPSLPQTQFLRRSFTDDATNSEESDPGVIELISETASTKLPLIKSRNTRARTQRNITITNIPNRILKTDTVKITDKENIAPESNNSVHIKTRDNSNLTSSYKNNNQILQNVTESDGWTESFQKSIKARSMMVSDNGTLDLSADGTNETIHELPVAEKLRSPNRYAERKGNLLRRGAYTPKSNSVTRRTTSEPTLLSSNGRKRPFLSRKPPNPLSDQAKCELFTNTVCLHTEDYPTEAIVQSIRRNKAAAGALLADFKNPGEGAVDGITPAQEAKYTAEHYLVSNRRGDTANRDFASAGEAGFMCPSTVKYARPQRARATSGQWKYIVNTGEHTQTLRLEKCLKPKESCTYLTDNFKSKCVQVYNYHRLLTWDQQNGLHMDIFKVPTCCSCHIEGYSVSFPPLGHRIHETSSEHFPGEDLSSEHGNQAIEAVQPSIQKPTHAKINNYSFKKAVDNFPSFLDNHNSIPGPLYSETVSDDEEFTNMAPHNLKDSYGNYYYSDSVNQASSIRNIRKPQLARNPLGATGLDTATLPSFLEPPSPSGPSTFVYSKDSNKYQSTDNIFKRGISRQNRRPIRKKISSGAEDLVSSGTSVVGAYSRDNLDTTEEFSTEIQSSDLMNHIKTNINLRATITPKLQAITTVKPSTLTPHELSKFIQEEFDSNNKRVNYNYHPIIDFFEDDENTENDSIDREDNISEFLPPTETEWKPINHPTSEVKN